MFNLRLPEIVVLALLAVFFFGSKNLPNLAKSIGESIKELKTSLKVDEVKQSIDEIKKDISSPQTPTTTAESSK